MIFTFELHPEEIELITLIRGMEFGTLEEVVVQNGLPKMVKTAVKNVKLSQTYQPVEVKVS